MIRIRQILYPTDFSPYSNQAYFHAVALAESHGASLTILYVYAGGFGAPRPPAMGKIARTGRRNWSRSAPSTRTFTRTTSSSKATRRARLSITLAMPAST